jgi:hypothetical protein
VHGPSIALVAAAIMGSGMRGWAFQDQLIRNQGAGCGGLRMKAMMATGMSRPTLGSLWLVMAMIPIGEIHVVLSVFTCVSTLLVGVW